MTIKNLASVRGPSPSARALLYGAVLSPYPAEMARLFEYWRADPCARRTVRLVIHARSLVICLALAALVLGFSSRAHAEERGAIGAEVHTSLGLVEELPITLGMSAWYRLRPAWALGVSGEFVSRGQHNADPPYPLKPVLRDGRIFEAFIDGRLVPDSTFGAFARASLGVAKVKMDYASPSEGGVGPALGLQFGPELRRLLTEPSGQVRPTWFLRLFGTLTAVPSRAFGGIGIALGCEG